jgi:chromosome segregation ATPase
MSGMTRCILRYGIIGGLALGGVTLLIGPDRVAMGLAQVRTKAQSVVDGCVDDPVALRTQLAQLADEYPDRIAEVKGEIAEVDHQIGQFERDIDIANRMVALATEDLTNLHALVERAEERVPLASNRAVFVRYEGVRFNLDEAYVEGQRINNVRASTQDRLAHDEVQLKFLQEQKARLAEILDQLETEFGTYQAQLWQLDRQIDSIERNERLIELTEAQQATLSSYERFGKVKNLKQIEGKLAELRAKQEAQLQTLAKYNVGRDYEKEAVFQLDSDRFSSPFDEIEMDDLDETDGEEDEDESDSLAWAGGPIVIE